MNQLISVIVPIYNTGNYLERCVTSIINQTYPNLEIILVNDGSTDASPLIMDRLKKRDKRILVINQENGGQSSARNAGLDKASGDYIAFVDSDDYVDEHMYEKMLHECILCDADIAVCGRFDDCKNGIHEGLCPSKSEVLDPIRSTEKMFRWDGLDSSPCDKLFKSQLWQNKRFPLGVVCEDIAVMYKVFLSAERICFIDSRLYYYRHRNDSTTTSAFNVHKFDYSAHTETILNYVRHNNLLPLIDSALFLREQSLLYTIAFIATIDGKDYSKYRSQFKSYKKELRELYRCKHKPPLVRKYLSGTLRQSYYKKQILRFCSKVTLRNKDQSNT